MINVLILCYSIVDKAYYFPVCIRHGTLGLEFGMFDHSLHENGIECSNDNDQLDRSFCYVTDLCAVIPEM